MRKEYVFRSFWDRDECYDILIRVLSVCGKRSSAISRPSSMALSTPKRLDTIDEGTTDMHVRMSDQTTTGVISSPGGGSSNNSSASSSNNSTVGVISGNSSSSTSANTNTGTSGPGSVSTTTSTNTTSAATLSSAPVIATALVDPAVTTPTRDILWPSSTSTKQYDLLNSGTAARRFSAPKSMETAMDPRSNIRPAVARPSSMSIFRSNSSKPDAVASANDRWAAENGSNGSANTPSTNINTAAGTITGNGAIVSDSASGGDEGSSKSSGKTSVVAFAVGSAGPASVAKTATLDDEEETGELKL